MAHACRWPQAGKADSRVRTRRLLTISGTLRQHGARIRSGEFIRRTDASPAEKRFLIADCVSSGKPAPFVAQVPRKNSRLRRRAICFRRASQRQPGIDTARKLLHSEHPQRRVRPPRGQPDPRSKEARLPAASGLQGTHRCLEAGRIARRSVSRGRQ